MSAEFYGRPSERLLTICLLYTSVHPVCQAHFLKRFGRIHGIFTDLSRQGNVFKSGEILNQVVKLKYKAYGVSSVCSKLFLTVFGNIVACQPDVAGGESIHAA